jgi:NADH dehydrogenase
MRYSQRAMDIRQITVFGGSGFIGRAIVRSLAKQGYLVRVAARRIEFCEPLKTAGDVGQITLMRANLRIPASVAAATAGSQAVLNATGIPFEKGRQRYQAVHVEGARTIAEAARAAGATRLIHISGLGADNRNSKNRYIRSKVAAEDAIVGAFDTATILRLSVAFGPNDVLFNRLAQIARKAPVMPVVGNGQAKVQPVFVGDVGAAAAQVLARPETAKKVFELGGPRVYTYRELAALTLREVDRRKRIVSVPAGLMRIAGFFAERLAFLIPPTITHDQVDLLVEDNVVRPGALSLADLGIQPTSAEAVLPMYLDRYRIRGRYNEHAPA